MGGKLGKRDQTRFDMLMLTGELAELARKRVKHLALDLGGHHKRGQVVDSYLPAKAAGLMMINYRGRNTAEDIKLVIEAMKRDERAAKPLRFGRTCLDTCYVCGRQIGLTFDGQVFGAETTCRYPDGLPEYSMRLAVPSGRIVAGNDFRDEYEQDAPDRIVCGQKFGKDHQSFKFDVNTDWGCRQVFMFYAKRGMAHGFVGNTCPGIYRLPDGRLTISQCRYDRDNYERVDQPGESVGSICTDLWWYSLADHDDLASCPGGKNQIKHGSVIKVEPGIYRVTHRYHKVDRDANVTDHYAVIERIR